MEKRATLVLLALMMAVLASCNPPPAAPPSGAATAAPADVTRQGWEAEWEQVIKEAKKEGKVGIVGGFGPEARVAFTNAFREKYGIDLEMTTGTRGGILAEKVIRESRAGLNLTDIMMIGGTSLLNSVKPAGLLVPFEPFLFLPEVKDARAWWEQKLPFLDKDKTIFTFAAFVSAPTAINTDMVKSDEVASMRDLLNPKWREKLIIRNPTVAGGGSSWFAVYGEVLMGYDFMREVARTNPMIINDDRLQVEWVARGKYPLAAAAPNDTVYEFQEAGAPLALVVPKEGTHVSASTGNLGIIDKTPHPNATRLFVNWFLSREGQTLYNKVMGQQSARLDAPTDSLRPVTVRQPGMKYVRVDDEEFVLAYPKRYEIAKEIFGHLLK